MYKVCLFFILSIASIKECYAQYLSGNLVTNYSFELNSNCAASSGGGGAIGWYSPVKNSLNIYSYANSCSNQVCCGVPSNTFGHAWQYARTGNGYVATYFSSNNGYNDRIYLQTKLLDTLKREHCYYIEFYANLFNNASYANNSISMLIGDTGIISYNGKYAPANPQIQLYGNPFVKDTMDWVKISGIYTAHGGERYITIGGFKDDAHIDKLLVSNGGYFSAYNIDDVSVYELDSFPLKADAGRDTVIKKGDSVWIGSRICGLQNVVWYDAGGNVIDTGKPGMWVKPIASTYYVIEQSVCGQYSRDTVNVGVSALPVVIDNYSLTPNPSPRERGVSVLNTWRTASEVNVSHFNVQRSGDGKVFETVGIVNARGERSTYTFNDQSPLWGVGGLYYRLEMVDKNGALSYSEIKELSILNNPFSISPNPASESISIVGSSVKQVVISDISGRVMLITKDKRIDIRGLVSGTYIVTIETLNGKRATEKLIKW